MTIKRSLVKKIFEHGEKDRPLEACGYLAGIAGCATAIYPMANIDRSQEHFTLDPQEQFAVVKTARLAGLKIMAVYHTHPASPAQPSAEDIRLAFDPQIIYVIASLQAGQAITAFKVIKGQVENIKLEIVEG